MKSIFARTIYTGKAVAANSYVVFNNEKIVGISKSRKGTSAGRFEVITPAFIDAHSHIGMIRAGEPSSEGEANEKLEMIMPVPDALDSVMMDDSAFTDSIEAGILYSCVVPGSGQVIGGRSAFIRNYGRNTTEALVARVGVKAAMGYNPQWDKSKPGQRPVTRMGALSLLRRKLHDVRLKVAKRKRARGRKKDDVEFSAEEEVLAQLLSRKERLRVHVHKIDDIAALLRLVDEYKLDITVEHTCDVNDDHIYRELKKRKIPVIYGPLDALAYKVELKHESWRNINALIKSGVKYGLMTDHPVILQRTLLMTLRHFLRCGLSKQDAIELISRKNAEVLGVDDHLGTLARGKWASFACWNGDPFDLANHVVAAYGEGKQLLSE